MTTIDMNDLLKIIIKCVEKSAVVAPKNWRKLVEEDTQLLYGVPGTKSHLAPVAVIDADLFLEALKNEIIEV